MFMTSVWILLLALLVSCIHADSGELRCPFVCVCSPDVHRVDCTNSGLDRVIWDLHNPGTLEQLILAHNEIQSLLNEISAYVGLQELDLSYNRILTIRARAFDAVPRLQYLRLQGNRLRSVPHDMFAQMRSRLLMLNLEVNEILAIADGAFSDLRSLSELYLGGNRLTSLTGSMFQGLDMLRSLYVNNNDLGNFVAEDFIYFSRLETLVLDMNRVSNISEELFAHLISLRRLSLEANGITQLPEYLFSPSINPPLLERLSLKNNKLRSIPVKTLANLGNLKELDISHNPFYLLDPDSFEDLTKLEVLIITNCPELAVIRDYSLSQLFNLHSLDISSNPKLKTIEKNAFISTHNFKTVNLKDNAFETLDVGLLPWTALETLVLTGNPWSCDCRVAFLTEVLSDLLNHSTMAGFRINEVRCATPVNLAGRSLVSLSLEETCPPQANGAPNDNTGGGNSLPEFSIKIMIAIICTFAGALLTCLAMLLWRTRHQNFHTDPKSTRNVRRRRLRKINREFKAVSTDCIREGPKLVSVTSQGSATQHPFSADGAQEGINAEELDDDDVFSNDPDIVASTHGAEEYQSHRVSFSDRVVVRTYECIEETESIETIENPGVENGECHSAIGTNDIET